MPNVKVSSTAMSLLSLICAAALYADVSPLWERGGFNINAREGVHNGIVLESQEVEMRLGDSPHFTVNARFVMRNPGNTRAVVTMGFPIAPADVKTLRVTVSGKAAKVRVGALSNDSSGAELMWGNWETGFDAASKTEIQVTYRSSVDFWGRSEPGEIMSIRETVKRRHPRWARADEFLKKFRWRRAKYMLQSGSQWSGRISRAVFRVYHEKKGGAAIRDLGPYYTDEQFKVNIADNLVELAKMREEYLWKKILRPNGGTGRIDGDALVLEFRDIEPRFSLDFFFNPFLLPGEEAGLLRELQKLEGDDVVIRRVISRLESLQGNGRVFESAP
ncbi:MAG: hypothetical protein JXA20_03020 [Spirochaetes bacterium]|nr:hypothetical protein [Spirochaetota bacterium]